MIVIREKTQGRKKYYEKLISKDGKSFDLIDTVIYRLVKVKSDSRDYFVLYTDEQESISPFFQYVNFEIGHLAYNTREQAAHALRQLYCYISLIKSDISKLKKKDIINMQFFLLGYSPKKGEYSFQLESMRRNNTVNDYISIYRAYFSFLGIDCPYLTESKITEYISKNAMGDDISQRVQTYAASLKEGTPVRRVPKYISIEDFGRIINIIRQDNNVTAEIIVRLMFEYGLRLGEVLGITNEDVTEKKVDGDIRPVIYIRNRASDNKKYQSAKTLLKVESTSTYDSPNYKQEKLGYEIIYLTEDFYDLLGEYIESTLSSALQKNKDKKSLADTVGKNRHQKENHYIFLNSLYSPLSSKSWNTYLKTVFNRANVLVDEDIKKHNLNHRFRHGFAMFNVKYRQINLFELKELMRHASISSTMVYYNPTENDEYEMKTEFVEDLYNLIPSLKEKPKFYAPKID